MATEILRKKKSKVSIISFFEKKRTKKNGDFDLNKDDQKGTDLYDTDLERHWPSCQSVLRCFFFSVSLRLCLTSIEF